MSGPKYYKEQFRYLSQKKEANKACKPFWYEDGNQCADEFVFDASRMDVKRLTGFVFFEDHFVRDAGKDNWYDITLSLYGRKKAAYGTEYSDCQQLKSQKSDAKSGRYNIKGVMTECEMDTEGGGWTQYTTYGPGYENNVAEVIFDIPDWKKELGFNEWYIEAENTKLWIGGATQTNSWVSHGLNLLYHNFIIGDKAYHADTFNFPHNNSFGAEGWMDMYKIWHQHEYSSYKTGTKLTFASYQKTSLTILKGEQDTCAHYTLHP